MTLKRCGGPAARGVGRSAGKQAVERGGQEASSDKASFFTSAVPAAACSFLFLGERGGEETFLTFALSKTN